MAIANGINPSVTELNLGGVNIKAGTGVPAYTAPKGSLYIRLDGSTTATRLYVNTTGAAVWTAITTVA